MSTTNNSILKDIPVKRVYSLAILMGYCAKENITLSRVSIHMNGFRVEFEGFHGDAILHDYSYGCNSNAWETIGFPWDYDDVSVHDPCELARLLGALKRGEYADE